MYRNILIDFDGTLINTNNIVIRGLKEAAKKFTGIREMLKKLKNLECRLAIVSAKNYEGIAHGLKLYELEDYIDTIVSASDITRSKPYPDPALKAMELLQAKASETLLLGDSPLDIQCGKAAGIKTVLAGWTIFPADRFKGCMPDFIINNPSELADIVSP